MYVLMKVYVRTEKPTISAVHCVVKRSFLFFHLPWSLRANLHVELGVLQRSPGGLHHAELHPLGSQHSGRVHGLNKIKWGMEASVHTGSGGGGGK